MSHSKLPEETVERLLKCQRWGVCDAGTAEICGVEIKTVHRFQRVAAQRAKEHHQQVVHGVEGEGVQLDEMHSKRRAKQVEWLHTALAMSSLFILWVEFGPRTTQTAARLIAQVVARLAELPMWLTDGWKPYVAGLLQVLGRLYRPRRNGTVGRFPHPRLVAPDDLFYAQVVKVRDRAGHLVEVCQRVIFGGPRRFFKELSLRKLGTTIQTAFMERWYGTRCLSWSSVRHQGRVWLIVSLYNWVLPHKSLRQGRQPCTPAMALGLAAHVWTYREYIWLPVHEDLTGKQLMEERLTQLLTPALPDQASEKTTTSALPKNNKKKRKRLAKKAA